MDWNKSDVNKFSIYLFKKIIRINESGCYSPIAIESAWKLLQTFGLIQPNDQPHCRSVMDLYSEDKLRITNQLFVSSDCPITNLNIGEKYSSLVQTAPFGQHSEVTREKINYWAFKASNYKLKTLVPPMIIKEDTQAVVINFVTFHSQWKYRVASKNVKVCTFYSSPNGTTLVDMMSMKNVKVLYKQTDDFQVLGIPYLTKNIVFFAVLPKDRYGLPCILRTFDHQTLLEHLSSTVLVNAEIDLPIFRFDNSQTLDKSYLMSLLGASNKREHSTDDQCFVLHHTFFEVAPNGSNVMIQDIPQSDVKNIDDDKGEIKCSAQFFAHHSFLFAVVDIKEENVLFLGQYCG